MTEKQEKSRTLKQNRSLHKWFSLLADELNNVGLDQRRVLKESVMIPWSPEAIKERIFKPILEIQTTKKSTTEMTTKEIDLIFDTINRHLGEKFGLHVAFPSIEELMLQMEIKKGNY